MYQFKRARFVSHWLRYWMMSWFCGLGRTSVSPGLRVRSASGCAHWACLTSKLIHCSVWFVGFDLLWAAITKFNGMNWGSWFLFLYHVSPLLFCLFQWWRPTSLFVVQPRVPALVLRLSQGADPLCGVWIDRHQCFQMFFRYCLGVGMTAIEAVAWNCFHAPIC